MPAQLDQMGTCSIAGYENIHTIGNADLLNRSKLAFFCSVKSPGDIILKTFDYAKRLRQANITVISGFHSPMEQECLRILLKGPQPVVICPARSIETMRIPSDWKPHIEQGRMLICSPFDKNHKRTTARTAQLRNQFVADIVEQVFVAYAAPNSKTESLCQKLLSQDKPIFTIDSPLNEELICLGAFTKYKEGLYAR